MKKSFFAVIPALLFASCSFWNEPVEEFFSYWTSEAYVTDSIVKVPNQNDSEGIISVASDKNAEVILNIANPKNFNLVMPSAGNTEMIHFNAFDPQPVFGVDYMIEKLSSKALKLTYTAQFLKKHEWGQKDLGASITMFADDGREFKKNYTFKIKSNTKPPQPSVILARTTESTPHYVLCLTVPDMDAQVNGKKLHKDIAQIVINESSYELKINDSGSDFVKPTDESFITRTDVTQLTTHGAEALPTENWTLFYKTDRQVGGAYKEYMVTLKDQKGLSSEKLETGTTTNKPAEETVSLNTGTQEFGDGSNALPFIIQAAGTAPEAQIIISCTSSGTTVHCTVTDVNTGISTEYNGNPVSVPLGLNGENEKLYEVKYNTKGDGYNPTTLKTKYYKILKLHTVTFNANGGKFADDSTAKTATVLHGRTVTAPSTSPTQDGTTFLGWYKEEAGTTAWNFTNDAVTENTTLYAKWSSVAVFIKSTDADAWKKLKEEAAKTSGVSVIVIEGEIKATTDSGNSGEITIGRNLTIQGKTGATTDKLDANGDVLGHSNSHRIFKVTGGKTLTLKNLTLKGGRAEKSDSSSPLNASGGGILLESGTLSLSHVTVSECKAITTAGNKGQGGGIYVKSGMLTLGNSTLSANEASKSGGAIYADTGTTVKLDICTIENCKASDGGAIYNDMGSLTIKGASKIKDNEATNNGGAFLIKGGSPNGSLHMENNCIVEQNKAKKGGGIYITDSGTAKILFCRVSQNEAQDGGGSVYIANGTFTIGGSTVITPSTGADENAIGKNDVYLCNGQKITVDDTLTTPNVVRITPATYNKTTQVLGGPPALLGSEHAKFTVTPKDSEKWSVNEQGKLALMEAAIDAAASPDDAWKKFKEAVKAAGDGAVITVKGEIKATNATDNSGEIVIDKDLTVKGKNGAASDILDANSNGSDAPISPHRIFKVASGKTLTLENLTLKGGKVAAFGEPGGGAIYAEGTLTMMNCTVTGNRIAANGGSNGGGICAGSTLTMTDCIVTDNTADDTDGWGGGGIYAVGTLTMTNCSITNNRTLCNGGGVYAEGMLSMTSCTMSDNKAQYSGTGSGSGGGIYAKGSCTMTGGAVTGNEAKSNGNGGGIYIGGTGSFTMTSGTVNNNETALGDGGGIYIDGTASLTMTGGTLTGNEAVNNKTGGGVYVNGTFTMKGASRITPSTGTEANERGKNDVYLANGKMITVPAALTRTTPVARITPATYASTTQVLTGGAVGTEHAKFTVTTESGTPPQEWIIKNDGHLQKPPITIKGSDSFAWKKLKDTVAAAADGDIFTIIGEIKATNDTDNSGELEISTNLTIKGRGTAAALDANKDGVNHPSTKHRIFKVTSGKTLTLQDLTLKGGEAGKYVASDLLASSGGAIRLNGGSASLSNVTISGCKAITSGGCTGQGGGIYAEDGGTLTLNNSTIKDCEATASGGAICATGGTINLTGCTITGNKANNGGAIHINKNGGGVYASGGSLVITSSTIGKCQATQEGGGIFAKGGSVELNSCTIKRNTGTLAGGGICARSNGSTPANVTINGGVIGGTSASEANSTGSSGKGGGIFVSGANSAVTLLGTANVIGNTAKLYGGGVFVDTGSVLNMQGSAIVTPSTGTDANAPLKNDVYLMGGGKIKLSGTLSGAVPVARITPATYATTTQVLTGGAVGTEHGKFTVTPKDLGSGNTQQWEINSTGFLQKTPVVIDSSGDAWKKLKDAVAAANDGDVIIIDGAIKATNVSGGKIEIKKNLTIRGKSGANSDILNANRGELGTNAHSIFVMDSGKTLKLENLTLKGGKGIAGGTLGGGAILIPSGSNTVELSDCVIEDCTADKGGAIGCGKGSTVTLTNTTIKNCTANTSGNTGSGGAIYAEGATVNITNCTFTGNKADKQGGAICAQKYMSSPYTPSNVTISGGTIGGTEVADANKTTVAQTDGGGGGIYIGEDCTLTMKAPAGSPAQGVQVIGNTAVYNGAGIYTKGNLTMENCTVTDNKTTSASTNTGGGGVYVESGTVEIKDATKIYHNYTDGSGGGIYVNDGTVTLTNATIGGEQLYNGSAPGKTKGNDAQYCGGIYVKNGTITMENCTLSSNTAQYGGGIQADNGNLTVNDCTLTNNEASFYGGGIYVKGGSLTLNNTTIGGDQFYDGTDLGKTKGNTAKSGGGVYIEGNGTSFTMNGGSIQYNKTIDGKGGGVYIKGEGISFTMNGGKITQCKADVTSPSSTEGRGGGIYIYGDNASSPINITIKGSAEISHNESTCQGTASGGGIFGGSNSIITVSDNATIKNNKAKGFGGGVYIKDTFKFTGGTITENTASLGAGICSEKPSTTLEMSGNARVTNDNDIYLYNNSVITITGGALTGTPPVARITVPDNKYLTSTQVLAAGAGVTLENETYKFAVTPQTSTAQPWTVGGNGRLKQGRYTEVPHGQLEAYLANASSTEVNYIEVTGISAADLTGSYGSPPDPGALGQKIKNNSAKKVALKLPDGLSVTDMSACFSQCENLVSLENFPSGVTDMRACFYRCENLTTVSAIPATVTDMKECFYRCENLTTALNIPAGVYDMTKCFQYCEKLQSIKMNCPYGVNFNGAFSGCDALPNGGIQVPSTQLGTYKANAGTMGTTPDKFSALP
ncbi:MAG: right-handed parallel beta-helix repeat-containing protein [Treponema sp.]